MTCSPLSNQQLYTATNRTTQFAITRWLKSNQQPIAKATTINPSHLPTTKLQAKRQPNEPFNHCYIIDNDHWGNAPTHNPVYFRVLSKNVNSLSTNDNNLQWRGAVQAMLDMDAHVLCIQESNLNWTDNIRQPSTDCFKKCLRMPRSPLPIALTATMACISPVAHLLLL